MSRQPRFEVVRTSAGWHARFRASNGQIVWTTESYRKHAAAVNAVRIIAKTLDPRGLALGWDVEVREVDER